MASIIRLYVSSDEDADFYKKDSKILNKFGMERGDQFVIAMALGYKAGLKTPLDKKVHLSNWPSMSKSNKVLMKVLAIVDTNDFKIISDEEKVVRIAEEYANTGIKMIQDFEKDSPHDLELDEFENMINNEYDKLELSE